MNHRIADFDIQLISDGLFEPSIDALVHPDAETLASARKDWGSDKLRMNINVMLLRRGSQLTLIDAGLGEAWDHRFGQGAFGRLRTHLRSQGIAPGEIGTIYLTHIHSDHAFGLFDGEEPYFPNATVHAPEGDISHYTDQAILRQMPEAKREPFEIAARLLRVYGDRVRTIAAGKVEAGIEAVALPGHSPGHTGYLIGRKVLTMGDTVHVPEMQIGDPRIGLRYDHDVEQARATRIDILNRAERNGWLLNGAHMDGINRLHRDNGRLAYSETRDRNLN
ncbi:MAG: MBL fold metallo-hydrolase [Rhizobiaceae bacterium]